MELDALRAQAAELMTRFDNMRVGYGSLQQKILKVNATVKSPDGYVTATVGPQGQVLKLELDPRIYRRPNSRELAATITKTIQEAAQKATEQVSELCSPFMPDSQFQAHMNFDFNGVVQQFEQNLPHVDGTAGDNDKARGRSS